MDTVLIDGCCCILLLGIICECVVVEKNKSILCRFPSLQLLVSIRTLLTVTQSRNGARFQNAATGQNKLLTRY